MNKAIMPMKCKNLISNLLLIGLVIFVFVFRNTDEKAVEEQQESLHIIVEKEPERVIHKLGKEDFEKLYSLVDDQIKDTCIDLSYEDAQILMKVAVLEDHTDEVSQAYIMTIILNRLKSDDFPNTIREVVEQKNQFLKLSDPRYKNAEPDVNSHIALALVERGEIKTDYLFYEALTVKNSWASRHRGTPDEYGGSRFYK